MKGQSSQDYLTCTKEMCCARIIVTAVTLFGSALQGELMEEQEQRGLLPVSKLELQPTVVKKEWLQQGAENNMTACHLCSSLKTTQLLESN